MLLVYNVARLVVQRVAGRGVPPSRKLSLTASRKGSTRVGSPPFVIPPKLYQRGRNKPRWVTPGECQGKRHPVIRLLVNCRLQVP